MSLFRAIFNYEEITREKDNVDMRSGTGPKYNKDEQQQQQKRQYGNVKRVRTWYGESN